MTELIDIDTPDSVYGASVYGVYFGGGGRVLLVKDANSSLWGFPGGGVKEGETQGDALRRELSEETGLSILGVLAYLTRQDDSDTRRYFYRIEAVEGQLKVNGNGMDVGCAAYFETSHLPLNDLAAGVKEIAEGTPRGGAVAGRDRA